MAVYSGDQNANTFAGSTLADTIYGRQANDTLSGGGGNDLIYGGQGDDVVTIGDSTEGANNGTYRSVVYGGEGTDSITSFGGTNTILGGTGINTIDPNDGADLINAQADSAGDLILGNGGADTIFGSSVTGGAGFGQNAQSLTQIFGGMGADIIGYGISGGVGSEPIQGVVSPVILVGNEGSDTIASSSSASTIYGGQSDDQIYTLSAGNDLLLGGEGADSIFALGGGNATILGGTGVNSIDATSVDGADYIVIANEFGDAVGNDFVFGNFGDDTIDASEQVQGGSDTLVGGQGNDVITAGAQVNDLIFGNQGDDTINAANPFGQEEDLRISKRVFIPFGGSPSGNSTIYGGQGDDVILDGNTASISNDLVYGGEGNDNISIYGGGSNTTYGGADSVGAGDGNNFIDLSNVAPQDGSASIVRERVFGGSARDAVSVGSAIDAVTITGAGGANQYAFTASSDSTSVVGGAGSGLDQITDFISGTDKFYLTDANGEALNVNSVYGAGSQSGQADLTAAANAAIVTASIQGANAATFSYKGSNYAVVDGDTSGGFSSDTDILINIASTTSLTKNDFIGLATDNNLPFPPF